VRPRELGSQFCWQTASGSGNTAPYAWYSGPEVATGALAAGDARIRSADATATTTTDKRKTATPKYPKRTFGRRRW
jgi:hypothetical protein